MGEILDLKLQYRPLKVSFNTGFAVVCFNISSLFIIQVLPVEGRVGVDPYLLSQGKCHSCGERSEKYSICEEIS